MVRTGLRRAPQRPVLNPVEYNLEKIVLKHIEDTQLKAISDSLADPRFCAMFRSLPDSEKQELLSSFKNTISYIDKKDKYQRRLIEEQARISAKYEVTEEIDSLDPKTYKLTKKLGRYVIEEYNTLEDESKKGSKKLVIKWNPVKEIMMYRQGGDPFRYIDFGILDFILVVLLTKRPPGTEMNVLDEMFNGKAKNSTNLGKGFDVINKYRKQLFDGRWHYKWFEWFWIVRYAQFRGPNAASRMLLAIDNLKGARIAPKYIRSRIAPTIDICNDFLEYSPYIHQFLNLLYDIVKDDPELIKLYRHQKMLIDNVTPTILTEQDENYLLELERLHMERMSSYQDMGPFDPQVDDTITRKLIKRAKEQTYVSRDHNNKIDLVIGSNRTGPDRIRIYHSNPNFKKEMEEYNNKIRKKKPKKTMAVCGPFNPWPLISNNLTKESYSFQTRYRVSKVNKEINLFSDLFN